MASKLQGLKCSECERTRYHPVGALAASMRPKEVRTTRTLGAIVDVVVEYVMLVIVGVDGFGYLRIDRSKNNGKQVGSGGLYILHRLPLFSCF